MPDAITLADLIDQQCLAHADVKILTFVDVAPDGGLIDETRTFGELQSNAARLAVWLQERGIGQGDQVILMLHNHPEFVEAMIATSLIGAAFVPVDPRSMGDKLVYMLNFVESRVVIAGDYALPAIAAVSGELSHAETILVVGRAEPAPAPIKVTPYSEALKSDPARLVRAHPGPDDTMFMMYTSGTTGNPKAVVRTHGTHMPGLPGYQALGITEGDTLYTGLPLGHINAQSTLGAGLSLALPVVISRKFTKSRLWEICRTHGCTVFTLLGGMIPEIYSIPEKPDDIDNPVRLVIASGMPALLWGEYKRRFGIEITEVYGSTEAGGVTINLMGAGPPGSIGKPPPTMQAAIFDETGAICPPGQAGELCFRPEAGEPRAVTYYRNEKASAQKVHGGWFRSGDIAHMDEEGWFYFHHRAGGGVRRNGDFVNTGLVETILSKSPLVEDVFVYGVQTAANVAGEKMLVAAVVLAEGAEVKTLESWCAGQLQRSEIPEIWQVLPAIPKTISEKPVERACIELLHTAGLVKAA